MWLLWAGVLPAQQLRVASLNCHWFFHPDSAGSRGRSINRPATAEEFGAKVGNLALMLDTAGFDVAALQEVGGAFEADTLGRLLGAFPGFVQGRDTYTGQDVALLFRQTGAWSGGRPFRLRALDAAISKHACVSLRHSNGRRVHLVAVHLLRPSGLSAAGNQKQLDALARWAATSWRASPGDGFVLAGDFNTKGPVPLPGWLDAFAPPQTSTTMIGQRFPLDRIVISPNLVVVASSMTPPRLPKRPNAALVRAWTDHFCVAATLEFPHGG